MHASPNSSELRRDPVSGDWVLIAPRRNRRPHQFHASHRRVRTPVTGCPFERVPETHEVVAVYDGLDDWEVAVVKNKFPALTECDTCPSPRSVGFSERMAGTGHHYLIVTRDHNRGFADLSGREALGVFKAFQDSCRLLAKDPCMAYVSMFHNWGPDSGATVYHPHYQVIALPVVPLHVEHSVGRSAQYGRRSGRCIHCELLKRERASGKRVIARSAGAIAIAPFAPRKPFEVRIFPMHHVASFSEMTDRDLASVAAMLQNVLHRLRHALRDPDFNFFIHTAPLVARPGRRWYHWHVEIVPHLAIPAGFELATHFDINPVPPETAARLLRGSR
ncbi:MAG: DUF4921 family protein [bacterium]|nr:DUF4921 family protein [bacterium]